MKIKALKCQKCLTIIYSRARWDFNCCKCKEDTRRICVDGGQDAYFKVFYGKDADYKVIILDLDVTLKQLFDDWNTGKDQFGIIPETKVKFAEIKETKKVRKQPKQKSHKKS